MSEEEESTLTANRLTANRLAYTPKHLADKILRSKSALEGERKQVTVLFADVKGSMELAEQLDPEEFSQIMQRFFSIEVAHAKHCRPDEVRAHVAVAYTQPRRGGGNALARAEQALLRAQELIEEVDARAFQPEVHECRAQLARVRGDARAADSQIEEARRLYAAMGATAQVDRLLNEVSA